MTRNWVLARDPKSGSWIARKQLPARIRAAYAATFGKGWEEKFSRPATLSEQAARLAFAEWLASVEARIAWIEGEMAGLGVDLNHIQAHALAGRWYRWKTASHYEDPGAAERWSDEIRALITNIASLLPKEAWTAREALQPGGRAPTPERFEALLDKLGDAKAPVLDRLAQAAAVPDFLAHERVLLSPPGRQRFLCALVYELIAVNALLSRRSRGDYSPDTRVARFPEWTPPRAKAGLSAMGLYKAWCAANETRTSVSTRNRWITVFRDLDRFWKDKDISVFTEDDAIQWRDELRQGGRTDKTVNFQYIAACKAVFGWATRPKTNDGGDLLAFNPFANFKLGKGTGSKKATKLRERSFTGPDWKNGAVSSPDRIQNALVFLDEPGEFFVQFDAEPGVQAGRRARGDFIYYKPEAGGRPKGISAPLLSTLIAIAGEEGAPVADLRFENLDIAGTGVQLPVGATGPRQRGYFGVQATLSIRAPGTPGAARTVSWAQFNDEYIHDGGFLEEFLPSAVEVSYARGGGFVGNRFFALGGSGLALGRGVRGVSPEAPYEVRANRFSEIGANGVRIGHVDADGADIDRATPNDYHPYGDVPPSAFPPDRARLTENIVLRDNVIETIGVDFLDAAGLFYANARGLVIDKNSFGAMPYSAINAGYGFGFFDGPQTHDPVRRYGYRHPAISGNVRITRNRMVGHGAITDDGGAVYTNSAQPDTLIEGNLFHPANDDVRWGSMFIDEGSSGLTIRDNVTIDSRHVVNFHCDAAEPPSGNAIARWYYVRGGLPADADVGHQLAGIDAGVLSASCDTRRRDGPNEVGDNYPRRLVGFGGPYPAPFLERPVLNPDISPESFVPFASRAALEADPRVKAILSEAGATPGAPPPPARDVGRAQGG